METETKSVERMLITAREAAAALGVCERTLYSLTKRGEIPAVHIGRAVRYDIESLKQFIKESLKNN